MARDEAEWLKAALHIKGWTLVRLAEDLDLFLLTSCTDPVQANGLRRSPWQALSEGGASDCSDPGAAGGGGVPRALRF